MTRTPVKAAEGRAQRRRVAQRASDTSDASSASPEGVQRVFTVTLPLPPRDCWPNRQRVAWQVRWQAQREARAWADLAATEAAHRIFGCPWEATLWRRCVVTITFRWPDKRKRDLDGALGACKPYLDALTDVGIWTDDSAIVELRMRAAVDKERAGVVIEVQEV